MKRYAAAAVVALVGLLGVMVIASGAQAQQTGYPVQSLQLHLSKQRVQSAGSFTAVASSSTRCTLLTVTWNGQSASAAGTKVKHTFKAPTVTKTTVMPIYADCAYPCVTGTSGKALDAATCYLRTSADVTVFPLHSTSAGSSTIPNTGGPSLGWFIAGGAAVLAGIVAMLLGRRRRGDKTEY